MNTNKNPQTSQNHTFEAIIFNPHKTITTTGTTEKSTLKKFRKVLRAQGFSIKDFTHMRNYITSSTTHHIYFFWNFPQSS